MKFELESIRLTQNNVKVVRMRKANSWEVPKLMIWPSAEGMTCFYWGKETTVPQKQLEDAYYAAVAYVDMTGEIAGFPEQELDVSNRRND